tara:strand:- start:320 stop:1024 length:705 start_codon:yes stop_codon:yes gene_type:complete
MKIIEKLSDLTDLKKDKKTMYIRYRVQQVKHSYWLKTRKSKKHIYIDRYDDFILQNLNPGKTCMFGSAGYYLEELIDDLTVVEQHQHSIVKTFYPKVQIISHRGEISKNNGAIFDNFIVINNQSDQWLTIGELVDTHISEYVKCMKPGCLFFYSFRDKIMTESMYGGGGLNRLTVDHEVYFNNFAKYCEEKLDLNLLWKSIKFANGDGSENPDTTNGNLKFIFQYKSKIKNINA